MDTIHLLVLSPKTRLVGEVKSLLSPVQGFQIHHLTSLQNTIPTEVSDEFPIVIVDLDSLEDRYDQPLAILKNSFPGLSLIGITAQNDSQHQNSFPDYFLVEHKSLDTPIFPAFLRTLHGQKKLVDNYSRVQASLSQRINELELIRKASLSLTMNLSLDAVLEAILDSAMELVSADDTHVFLYEHGVLSFASAVFGGQQQTKAFMDPRPEGITYQVARGGKKIVVNDTTTDPLFEDRPWEGSITSLPLKIGQKVLGVMNVALKRAHTFSSEEIQVLEFLADQAAIAIQNAKLYEQAQQEIADRKKAEKAIKHLANHDALTGLPNRRLFTERIQLEIARSERSAQKFCLMLFDLDQLKEVNDSYGHNVGDLLLQAVSQRLLALLRKSDTVARMGGDEFLLILPEMKNPQDAIQTAERILLALSTPFHLEGYQIIISTSIGITFFPDNGKDMKQLLKNADIAMYQSKQKGGNVFHLYTP
jgi:diguanylate cyclase (GGDEF)-like protein